MPIFPSFSLFFFGHCRKYFNLHCSHIILDGLQTIVAKRDKRGRGGGCSFMVSVMNDDGEVSYGKGYHLMKFIKLQAC